MSFANPLPWWALALLVLILGAIAWLAYNRRTLTPRRRAALVALRFLTLLALLLFLLRPVARDGRAGPQEALVPILVDTSRSMSLEDAARGGRRIDRARQLVTERVLPALGSRFQSEVLAFGDAVTPVTPPQLSATGRRSDLEAALAEVTTRYRGRALAGIVLISDGGDTSGAAERVAGGSPPIFPVGVGSAVTGKDREVLSVTAAEAVLDDSRVDLAVSAIAHGFDTNAIELRLLENGRPIDVRRVVPAADGTPIREVFQVSPGRGAPTVYTVEIPAVSGELVPENNARSTLVQPPARPRRVLLVEGAPGFEHSFFKRALGGDPGLEVDAVVRQGKNEQGADTFYIQAARVRGDGLTAGYPATRETLFAYDAVVLANVEGHQFTRAQLDSTRAFVGARGGGLLVLGGRSFLRQGLAETPIEEVLPLDLTDRGGELDVLPAASVRGVNRATLTAAGEAHPMMQLAPTVADTRTRWNEMPALSAVVPLGGPRPGASVLAVATAAGGGTRALVAVQRFGEGRAMVFTGEASWRWRMLLPAKDRSYDTFWKQAVRWLALPAGDPVAVTAAPGSMPGEPLPLQIIVRDAAFEPQKDVAVDVHVTSPGGRLESLKAVPAAAPADPGRYVATFHPDQSGVYRVSVDATRGGTALGGAATAVLVGGADLEMTDPRLNLQLLQRVAAASGGQVLREDDLGGLGDMLKAAAPAAGTLVRRDLWHTGWSFTAVLALLGAEWLLRRRWGLR